MGHYDDDYRLEARGFDHLRQIWNRNDPVEVKKLKECIDKNGLEKAIDIVKAGEL